MDNWQIMLLHTRQTTLLQRAFEAAFPGRVISVYAPELGRARKTQVRKSTLVDYFRDYIYDGNIWKDRVLTVYGSGEFHHWTYALTRLALDPRNVGEWTYFHFDQHRDDWGDPDDDQGVKNTLDCACFVDQLAHDHGATPFMVGPEVYPRQDAKGYEICGKHIPLYHNWFTQKKQRSKTWHNNVRPLSQTGLELPATADLRKTPVDSYFSFDLDLLSYSEIVTNYDQNEDMTLRRVCQILDKVRPFKRLFSADILGFPEGNRHHALSCLTMIILARKIMGLGTRRLMNYHTEAKRRQAAHINRMMDSSYSSWGTYWEYLSEPWRESPIEEEELMEVLRWAQ